MRYAIVIENAGDNFSAYVPDLPGCIATGETLAATEQAIREAIEFHLEGMREDGTPIPPPSSHVDYVEAAAKRRAGPRNRPTAKPTAESGEGRGLEGDGEVQVFSNLLISICVYVGSNPTLSATLRAFPIG